MTVTAAPTLTAAGTAVATGGAGELVAVDELRITWGRSSLLARPTPATAQLTVRDTSPRSTFATRTDLIGQPVILGYAGGVTGTNFRGRITDVAVRMRRAGGFYVDLACSSKEVDAANYVAPAGTVFPAETFTARLARIRQLMPAGLFAGITMPSRYDVGFLNVVDPSLDFGDYPAAQMDVSGTDALSLLRQLFDSVYPAPLVYDPAADVLTWAPRRLYAYRQDLGSTFTAQLVTSTAAGGRYIVTPIGGLPLHSGQFSYDGPLTQQLDSRITRTEVTYLNAAAGYASATITAAGIDAPLESAIGRRTLTVDSIHASATNATALAANWSEVADGEARRRRLDPLTYDTARNGGGFDTAAHAVALLTGAERADKFFARGSWLTRLGSRPLFGSMGGTLTHAGGQWTSTFAPAPVSTATTPRPITPATAAVPGVRLIDVDPSVTVGDLGFVDVGAGFTPETQPL
jgi:hypothetical protein